MKNIAAIDLPFIYYSTWGEGGYSSFWMKNNNSWMYSLLKFIEANIEFNNDKGILTLFEKLSASDYPFMLNGIDQVEYAKESFMNILNEILARIQISKNKILTSFPIDPYSCYFSYVLYDQKFELNKNNLVKFKIYKLGNDRDVDPNAKRFNILEPNEVEIAKFIIYFQKFVLYPDFYYLFTIPGHNISKIFKMPERGIPVVAAPSDNVFSLYKNEKLISNLIKIWGPQEELPKVIQTNKISRNIFLHEHIYQNFYNKNKVAIYKYNKETYSLLRLKNFSHFKPVIIFDDKISIDDASEYLVIPKTNCCVTNNINNIDNSNFDLLIITCAINFESEVGMFKSLVSKAIENNIPIISLYEDILSYEVVQDLVMEKSPSEIYKISVTCGDIDKINVGKYIQYKSKKVLGVFGTDSVQGKFTTQVLLREELKEMTTVKHFATEPTGILLGADVGFSRVEATDESEIFAFYRSVLESLEDSSKVIITGGQNSLIYNCKGETDYFIDNASTRIFKIFLPKWIILTISIDTELETIKKTLRYINFLNIKLNTNAEVIAFSLIEGRKIYGHRWTDTYFIRIKKSIVIKFVQSIEKMTGIKVYIIPEDIKNLADSVMGLIEQSPH